MHIKEIFLHQNFICRHFWRFHCYLFFPKVRKFTFKCSGMSISSGRFWLLICCLLIFICGFFPFQFHLQVFPFRGLSSTFAAPSLLIFLLLHRSVLYFSDFLASSSEDLHKTFLTFYVIHKQWQFLVVQFLSPYLFSSAGFSPSIFQIFRGFLRFLLPLLLIISFVIY